MADDIKSWDQQTGLVSSGVSSCISPLKMVFGILRSLTGISHLVMVSWQKLQVECVSKCRQSQALVLPLTNLPSKLSYFECDGAWDWPRL